MVDETARRRQAEAERCALLELLLVLSQRPGQRTPAAQLRQLAAAFHVRLFVAPHRQRPASRGEADTWLYAVDLVRADPHIAFLPLTCFVSCPEPCSHLFQTPNAVRRTAFW